MDPVEVWDAGYTPLGPTKVRRAIALVNMGLAHVHAYDTREILHMGKPIKLPKIIVLLKMLHVPIVEVAQEHSRRGVLERDNYQCGYCRKPAHTMDHILPKSRGGKDTWENTIAACIRCNGRKDNKTPQEAGMPLLFQPTVPTKYRMQSKSPRRPKKKK